MPMTPAFQLSCARRIAFPITPRAAICRSASSRISFSVSRRFWLYSLSVDAISSARAISSPSSRCTASSAVAMRPAALRRGAIMNETVISSTRGWLNPAARSNAENPVRDWMCFSPQAAITRFSPVSETTSAMVATAASASSSGAYSPSLSA
ncbi:hypothetical protein SDC9_115237 [bioreactor metagenome]|uniref:Uncharacterized protein n=1 Tax=bioreactor metagenome TaxID=1076179 RepID=A0A645BSF3_9ZZZZ